MKRVFFLFGITMFFLSCSNRGTSTSNSPDPSGLNGPGAHGGGGMDTLAGRDAMPSTPGVNNVAKGNGDSTNNVGDKTLGPGRFTPQTQQSSSGGSNQ